MKVGFIVTGKTAKETLANAVLVRRTALKDGDRSFGYPSIVNVAKLAKGDAHLQTAYAAMFTEKYASIIVMENMTYAQRPRSVSVTEQPFYKACFFSETNVKLEYKHNGKKCWQYCP